MSMRVSCGSRTYIDDVCTVSALGPYFAKMRKICKLYLGEYLGEYLLRQKGGASNPERGASNALLTRY